MKYAPHPEADKRASQMVWRGRGRTVVQALRRDPLVDTRALVGASAPVISESAAGGVFGEPPTVADSQRARTQPPKSDE